MSMIRWFFEVYNWRFWWFAFLIFSPCIAGIIGCAIHGIKERLGGYR